MVHYPFSYHLITLLTRNLWPTMVAEIHAVADATYLPTYTAHLQLEQVMHGLHMSEMLGTMTMGRMMKGLMISTRP